MSRNMIGWEECSYFLCDFLIEQFTFLITQQFISNLGFDSALKVVCEITNLKAQSCQSFALIIHSWTFDENI